MTRALLCPRQTGLIARVTLIEATRQRLPQVLLLGAIGLVVVVQGLRELNFGLSELKFIADLGFGAMAFFGSILAVFFAAHLFCGEIEGRSTVTVLAKAVGRTEFVVGKFCGVLAILALFSLVMTLLIAAMLHSREAALLREQPGLFEQGGRLRYADVFATGFGHALRFGVLAAFSLLIASGARSGLQAVMASFCVLVICDLQHVAQEVYANAGAMPLRMMVAVMALFFPDFQVFDLGDVAGAEDGIRPGILLRVAGYALGYIGVAVALAALGFKRREI